MEVCDDMNGARNSSKNSGEIFAVCLAHGNGCVVSTSVDIA